MLRDRLFQRHPANPIVRPGKFAWRRAVTFNPGVIESPDGRVYLLERTAGGLRPFHCCIGALVSEDGIHFEHLKNEPVFTPEMAGSQYGSVQDPRIVRLDDGRYYMSFAFRPYAWASFPTGVGVPDSEQVDYPGFSGRDEDNQTRSGLAVSDDLINWRFHSWVTPEGMDDRNVILFPEKIGGRYYALRRPSAFVGTHANHAEQPGIQISHSSDLISWSDPEPLMQSRFWWEGNRIGGSTPPVKTPQGWLIFYHGVETVDASVKQVVYRTGIALLDLENPRKVRARHSEPVLEPTEYYEHHGVYIPSVVFPTGALLRGINQDEIWLYYGVCDTAIALATAKLQLVMDLFE